MRKQSKTVCIIGAGAAGLAAARHSIRYGYQATIFEQTGSVGGTWVYSEETGSHSSMYRNLITNLPKEVMQFQDFEFDRELPSFLTHQDVCKYLEDYSQGLPIKFHHTIKKVQRVHQKWKVTISHKDSESTMLFDIIFVCNGHYFEPNNPFNDNPFQGKLIHSHDYREPSQFAEQNVIVIGAGPSGVDIALQVAEEARKVTLIGCKANYPNFPGNIEQIQELVAKVSRSGCVTSSGRRIEAHSIIVCTGYYYKFPFLSEDIIQLKENGHLVSPLYEHVVHANYPTSLYFIGLNLVTITFPLFEYQIKLALALSSGKVTISESELHDFEQKHIRHQKERGLEPRCYHLLNTDQWEYMRRLARIGRFPEWRNARKVENIVNYLRKQRKVNVCGYKKINFKLDDSEQGFCVVENKRF